MTEKFTFSGLPSFKETIARIARVPAKEESAEKGFVYCVRDETNKLTYKIKSPRELTPADVRRVLARAFTRTDAWPDESGEVEILA